MSVSRLQFLGTVLFALLFCGSLLSRDSIPHCYHLTLVKQYWHTGIVGDSALIACLSPLVPPTGPPIFGIDIGWGDSAFYQQPAFDLATALAALFTPTPAVIRVQLITEPLEQYLARQEWVAELCLTAQQWSKLCSLLRSQFRSFPPSPITSSAGIGVRFYPAVGIYSVFKTCNTWIAEILESLELLKDSTGIVTVNQLFVAVCRFAVRCRFD